MVQEQAKRERRLAKWGEAVAVALAERDAAVSDCEQRAGRALGTLIGQERLSTQEALVWCGGGTLTGREVYRLIRGVADGDDAEDVREEQVDDLQQGKPTSMGTTERMPG